ncbi:unnamed protein product, partial [Amoebophrya sp. A25]
KLLRQRLLTRAASQLEKRITQQHEKKIKKLDLITHFKSTNTSNLDAVVTDRETYEEVTARTNLDVDVAARDATRPQFLSEQE